MARSVCRCTDKETIGWCLRDVQEEADAGRVGVDGVAFQMRLQVLELRDNIEQIYDFFAQVRIYQKHLALAAPMHTRLQCYSVMCCNAVPPPCSDSEAYVACSRFRFSTFT